jgi:hypothetical protein
MRFGSAVARAGLVVGVLGVLAATGCYRGRSQLIATSIAPEDLYRCLQLELGRAGYAIIGADRASGWLKAQRRIDRFIEVASADIYATVIPVSSGTGAPVAMAIVSPLH